MLEDKIQNPSKCLFQFTLGGNVMDQRSGDGRLSGRLKKTSHSIQGYTNFPNFEMLDARIASALNKIIPNSYFKRSVWRNRKLKKKIDFLGEDRSLA